MYKNNSGVYEMFKNVLLPINCVSQWYLQCGVIVCKKMLAGEEASIELVQRWLQRRGSDDIETG